MTDQISINFLIAGQSFKIKVAPEDEGRMREAAKLLNHKISAYKETFDINSIERLLMMVALDETFQRLNIEEQRDIDSFTSFIEKTDTDILSTLRK